MKYDERCDILVSSEDSEEKVKDLKKLHAYLKQRVYNVSSKEKADEIYKTMQYVNAEIESTENRLGLANHIYIVFELRAMDYKGEDGDILRTFVNGHFLRAVDRDQYDRMLLPYAEGREQGAETVYMYGFISNNLIPKYRLPTTVYELAYLSGSSFDGCKGYIYKDVKKALSYLIDHAQHYESYQSKQRERYLEERRTKMGFRDTTKWEFN